MPENISKRLIEMHDKAKEKESQLTREGKLRKEGPITSITNVEQNLKELRLAKQEGEAEKADQMEKALDLAVEGVLENVSEGEGKEIIDYVDMATVDRYYRQGEIDMEKVSREEKEETIEKFKALVEDAESEYGYFLEGQEGEEYQNLVKAEKNGLKSILRVFESYMEKNPEYFGEEAFEEMKGKIEQQKEQAKEEYERKKQEAEKKYGNASTRKLMLDKYFDEKRKKIAALNDELNATEKGKDQIVKSFLEYQQRFKNYVGEKGGGQGKVISSANAENDKAA